MQLICGVYHLNGRSVAETPITAMIAAMVEPHLKPVTRVWQHNSVALAVLDFPAPGLSAPPANLPTGESATVLAADLRLHERQEVFDELHLHAANHVGISDEALTLRAIERWGDDAGPHLLGDFAMAAWDPGTKRLLCARDSSGVRPFFYTYRPGELFAFASLPRALHQTGFATPALNEAFFLARMAALGPSPQQSLFRDIRRLPAAHSLVVSRDGLSQRRYWHPTNTGNGHRRWTPEEAAEGLYERVRRAVECRLPLDSPVATHLSGGLDSSAITVLAARTMRERPQPILAYSFLATQPVDMVLRDEQPYVDAVLAQEAGIVWTPIYREPLKDAIRPQIDVDQPVSINIDHPEQRICAHAVANGASVILSGWGGDEGATFNGRGTLAESLWRGKWRHAVSETAAIARRRNGAPFSVFRGEVLPYVLPDMLQRGLARIRGKTLNAAVGMRAAISPLALRKIPINGLNIGADGRRNRFALLTNQHLSQRAEEWALIGARHGVAFTFPMLDRRVIEFALVLPSDLFIRGGWKRRPFRDAMSSVLPEQVLWRHQKYSPFPCLALDLAEKRHFVIARVDELRQRARVAELFDLDAIADLIQKSPSPAEVRRQAIIEDGRGTQLTSPHIALIRILQSATYIEQHHSGTRA